MTGYAERYFYPGTATLINHFGVKDRDELARREAAYSRIAMRQPVPGGIELSPDSLRRINRHLFSRVYPWAGEFRSVDMVKLQVPGLPPVRFAPGSHVERVEVPRLFGELQFDMAASSFSGLDRETFGYRAAVYIADLNYIHPFPEGNGRCQRILLEEIAKRAGYCLDHTRIGRAAWLEAAIESYGQDAQTRGRFGAHGLMTTLIAQAVEPLV